MNDDIASPFGFPAVRRKKVTAAFDSGRITSDGGVLLLAQAETRYGAKSWACQRRVVARIEASTMGMRENTTVMNRTVLKLVDAAIFNVIIGNADAHSKNFSLLRQEGGGGPVVLAPLYDLVGTVMWPELSPRFAMTFPPHHIGHGS